MLGAELKSIQHPLLFLKLSALRHSALLPTQYSAPSSFMPYSEIVEAEGHLVDSQILSRIFDRVIECGCAFEVVDFRLGRTNEEFSRLKLRVVAPDEAALAKALEELVELGCYHAEIADALLRPAPANGVVPEDFYSTTNHRTHVRDMVAHGSKSERSEWMR